MRLGTHCYKHAWHAELWHKRLPELREMNPDRLTQPANDAMVRFVEAMTEPEAPDMTDREARRRLPRVHPPLHRGLHVPPQQHQPDHRCADDPLDQLHPPGRVRRLARRRDDVAIAHRDARRGRSRCGASGAAARRSWWRPAASPAPVRSARQHDRSEEAHEEVLPRRGVGPRRAVPHRSPCATAWPIRARVFQCRASKRATTIA